MCATLECIINKVIKEIINPLIPVLIGIGLIVFFWGIIQFVLNADSEEKRSTGKQHMIWGILGIFIMVSVWGIIYLLQDFFGVVVVP